MSGWEQTHRLALPEPWTDMWVEVYDNPPLGLLFDLGEQVAMATSDPRPEIIEQALAAAYPYIAAHNLTDREGRPLEWSLRSFAPSLVVAVLRAIGADLQRGAETGPLPRAARRARSRGRSSPASRSPRASASGSSRAA